MKPEPLPPPDGKEQSYSSHWGCKFNPDPVYKTLSEHPVNHSVSFHILRKEGTQATMRDLFLFEVGKPTYINYIIPLPPFSKNTIFPAGLTGPSVSGYSVNPAGSSQ